MCSACNEMHRLRLNKSSSFMMVLLLILLLSLSGDAKSISHKQSDLRKNVTLFNSFEITLKDESNFTTFDDTDGTCFNKEQSTPPTSISHGLSGKGILNQNPRMRRYNKSNVKKSTNVTMLCSDIIERDNGNVYCNMSFDGLSCWPTTLGGDYAIIQCPLDMKGIDSTQNASRFCNENGTWTAKAEYGNCILHNSSDQLNHNDPTAFATLIIYKVGFGISTVALVIALFIFLYFRSLRCLRNRIHSHLIVTFILSNTVWFIMQSTLQHIVTSDYMWLCRVETVICNYALTTNFFWMLIEGLYLHIIIVWTYSSDKIRLWYFLIIGWVIPAIIITIWSVMRARFVGDYTDTHVYCWLPHGSNSSYSEVENIDYVYIAPILFVLAVNMLFLASIIWVLVTKLRASHTMESRQLRKAVKATLLLFPLLGITYVIFLWSPEDIPALVEAHQLVNAFLQSFQGFFVALFYCFLNGEVKGVLKKKFQHMQDSRNLNLSTRYTKTSIGWANDLSRKESLALANGRLSMGYYDSRDRNIDDDKEETENML